MHRNCIHTSGAERYREGSCLRSTSDRYARMQCCRSQKNSALMMRCGHAAGHGVGELVRVNGDREPRGLFGGVGAVNPGAIIGDNEPGPDFFNVDGHQ